MKTIITLLFIILTTSMMITGCYSENAAKKRISKAQAIHPQIVANYCADLFPSGSFRIDSLVYIQGNSVIIKDTVSYYDTVKQILKQQVLSYKLRVDTVFRLRNAETVNKAREHFLRDENAKLNSIVAVKKNQNKVLYWVVIVLGVYTLLRWLLRYWGIKLP